VVPVVPQNVFIEGKKVGYAERFDFAELGKRIVCRLRAEGSEGYTILPKPIVVVKFH
jgi:hypothetical protein